MLVVAVWRHLTLFCVMTVAVGSLSLRADDEPVSVKVGGYQFEPFVEGEGGLSVALAKFLSDQQNRYQFEFMEVPARRRYDMIVDGKIDMIFFELPIWGWNGLGREIVTTMPLLKGSEVFVARRDHPLGKDVFHELQKRRIALTFGYHYAFVGLTSDPDDIRAHYDVVFAQQQLYTLRHVMNGNADLGVVNNMFLARAVADDPGLADAVRVGERVDQHYELPILMRRDGPISRQALDALLVSLMADGRFEKFVKSQNIPADAALLE